MVNENRTGDSSNIETEDAPAQNSTSRPTPAPKPGTRAAKVAASKAATPTQATSPVQAKRRERREEMIKQRREERLNRYEKQRQQWLYTRIGIAILAVVVVLGLGYGAYAAYDNYQDKDALKDVVSFDYTSGQHVQQGQPVSYTESPPVGGQHDPYWQTCQFYSQPIRSENAVHSLEHGAVWITYRPDLPQDQIDELQQIADGDGFILVSPYPNLQAPVVVQSWNHQLVLTGADDSHLKKFIKEYKTNPDTTPEYGASCSGGVTTTVSG